MDTPSIPDPNQAAVAGATQDLKNFPFKYIIDAAAKMGQKVTVNGHTYDFSGLGDADNAGAISDKMAQVMLEIQKGYGGDFIKQRLADLKQSDPTGYAARQQLFDKIMADADAHPDRPLAQDTQDQVVALLNQGGRLTGGPGGEEEQVQQGVRGQQLRNGIFLGNAPASAEASAVETAGEAKRTASQEQALGFQTSGVSPEDVEYRRIQQSLGNMGAFVSGQNPTAEFGSLSAAGNGAAPFTTSGNVNASIDPNAALRGITGANSIYAGNVSWNQGQVNPFLAGISGAINGARIGMAYQPAQTYVPPVSSGTSFQNYNPSGMPGDTY